MNSRELNRLLIINLSYLEEKYMKEINWQDGEDTGSHVIYGDVLTPALISFIKGKDICKLEEIFNFIEYLLEIKDCYVEEVVMFSILESILFLLDKNEFLEKYIGKNTKNLIDILRNENK